MDAGRSSPDERLLSALAEQLKVPLTQIARQAELGDKSSLEAIRQSSDAALRLVEGFLLSSYLHGQRQLQLEPVSLKALLYNVAHQLEPIAHATGCSLELEPEGRYGQVMAHTSALETALVLMTHAFIQDSHSSDARVVISTVKNKGNIQVGVYGTDSTLTDQTFRGGSVLYGRSKQALPNTASSTASELYLADSLLQGMASRLSVGHLRGLAGLNALLVPSKQMELVGLV